jgi:hypothetical protein
MAVPRIFRLLLRWMLYAVLAVVVLLASLYAWLVFANRQDDAPEPIIAEVLNESLPQVAPERNGYFAWVGVMGPEAAPSYDWGRRWFEQALAADAAAWPDQSAAQTQKDDVRSDDWPKEGWCRKVETCLDDVAADPAQARVLLASVRTTLERGDAAMAFPEYQEPARPDFGVVSAIPTVPMVWLPASSTRFALDVAEGRHAEALARLAREVKFHTAQAAGAETLIAKLLAFAGLRNDYLLLAQYARRYPNVAIARHAQIKAMLAPLPAPATSMYPPLRSETRGMVRLLGNMRNTGLTTPPEVPVGHGASWRGMLADWLWLPMYLPHATASELFRFNAHYMDAELLEDDADYRNAVAAAYERGNEYQASLLESIEMRNPAGRVLVGVATMDFRSYLFRRDDLLALRAVVALRQDMRAAGWPAEKMANLFGVPELVHRYTGESPVWDEAAKAIVYPADPMRKNREALSIPM